MFKAKIFVSAIFLQLQEYQTKIITFILTFTLVLDPVHRQYSAYKKLDTELGM